MNTCAKILRRFHDIAATSYLCEGRETICHCDFAPWNVIFEENEPVGVIDFDEATPGERIEDLAYFIWIFLDLGIAEISDDKQIHRVVELCKAYGSDYCRGLVGAMLGEQKRILNFRHNIILTELDPMKRKFSLDAIDRIELSMKWLTKNSMKIEIGLARLQ